MKPEVNSRAIRAAGSVSELARRVGVQPQAVSQWRRIPADRAADVERATGIPRYELRPDLWDAPSPASAEAA